MKEIDQLIYEKSNTYRLHADNLRWTLLGGYAAFFAAAASLLSPSSQRNPFETAAINLLLFVVSNGYLLILAVQNWFYNLFARFVKECEQRLREGKPLRPLEEFAFHEGQYVNPFHPAFFFAELVVTLTSFYFLYSAFASPLRSYLDFLFGSLPVLSQLIPSMVLVALVIVLLIGYLLLINHFLFRHWNATIYRHIIVPFSNLWQPLHDKSTIESE